VRARRHLERREVAGAAEPVMPFDYGGAFAVTRLSATFCAAVGQIGPLPR
jgi:hypothetical protein